MGNLYSILLRVSKILSYIGAVALTFMMLLTVADVILRAGGRPILGTYEIVAFSLAIVIGFTIPQVSLDRGHVLMEIVLDKVSKRSKTILNTFTRLLCIILFAIVGYNLFLIGNELITSGEVSSTLKLPFYPIAYGVGVCSFIECFVFIFDIVREWRGENE
ncbi:MAG: TRAP transporter small permease [Thermodesulfobacteriota bacterium]